MPMALDERELFDERQENRKNTLHCPHCRQSAEYDLMWLIRTKKRQLPPRADERDRAKFAKARSYMVRRDDLVACKNLRCRKRFEVSGVQAVVFFDDAGGGGPQNLNRPVNMDDDNFGNR